MARIFISYRRDDSRTMTGRIYDRLVQAFDRSAVFKDIDLIPPGSDFPAVLREAVEACRVQLVIIGHQWVSISDEEGQQRLANPEDYVRQEVELALRQPDVTVIPVLVLGAEMPSADDLPSDLLKRLTRLNAVFVRDDPDFHRDMDRLVQHLQELLTRDRLTSIFKLVSTRRRLLLGGTGILVIALLVLALATGVFNGGTPPTDTLLPPSDTPPSITQEAVLAQTEIETVWTPTALPATPDTTATTFVPGTATIPAATNTLVPPSPTATDTPSIERNDDWVPVIEVFEGVEMVLVPAGCFMMGSTEVQEAENVRQCVARGFADSDCQAWYGDEGPAHEVCFDAPFWIDRYEVSNAQFLRFGGLAEHDSEWMEPDGPREQISWLEANEFCRQRGARLPTEAEWEYAARGPEGLVYPWGNVFIADYLVWAENSNGTTQPVGSRPEGTSWVGAYDVSGNVWEWVADWYSPYEAESQINPSGLPTGQYRVLRGGSWDSASRELLRTTVRDWDAPEGWVDYAGFRCAADDLSTER